MSKTSTDLSRKKIAVLLLSFSCIIVIAVFVATSLFNNRHQDRAPAHMGAGLDITLPMEQYNQLVSSVPGYPLLINAEEADSIIVKSTEGSLLEWTEASQIIQRGQQLTIQSGDSIYWSPTYNETAKNTEITIIANKDNNEIARQLVLIRSSTESSAAMPVYSGVLLGQ